MTICCRYDVDQSNIRSDVKQSVSKNHNITDFKSESHVKPSELDYEVIETDAEAKMKVDCVVNLDTNPAYQCDVEIDTNPAYECDFIMDTNPAYHVTS